MSSKFAHNYWRLSLTKGVQGFASRPGLERLWEKTERAGPDDCWTWVGSITKGYGRIKTGGKGGGRQVGAHRYAYELLVGSIPDGLTIDHLCRNTLCVNPRHMEVATRSENASRAHPPHERCKRGHEYTPENRYVDPRGRQSCRECGRLKDQRYYALRVCKCPGGVQMVDVDNTCLVCRRHVRRVRVAPFRPEERPRG